MLETNFQGPTLLITLKSCLAPLLLALRWAVLRTDGATLRSMWVDRALLVEYRTDPLQLVSSMARWYPVSSKIFLMMYLFGTWRSRLVWSKPILLIGF